MMCTAKIEVRDSLNGIFGSWARWIRAPPDVQSCWDAVVIQARKLLLEVVFKVLGSLWEILKNRDWVSTQNFVARLMRIVVCPAEPFLKKKSKNKKMHTFENKHVLKFQECQFSRNKSPCGRLPP